MQKNSYTISITCINQYILENTRILKFKTSTYSEAIVLYCKTILNEFHFDEDFKTVLTNTLNEKNIDTNNSKQFYDFTQNIITESYGYMPYPSVHCNNSVSFEKNDQQQTASFNICDRHLEYELKIILENQPTKLDSRRNITKDFDSLINNYDPSEQTPKLTQCDVDIIPSMVYSDKLVCLICHNNITNTETINILKCQHYFHKTCLTCWLLEYNNNCPHCRLPVLTVS